MRIVMSTDAVINYLEVFGRSHVKSGDVTDTTSHLRKFSKMIIMSMNSIFLSTLKKYCLP